MELYIITIKNWLSHCFKEFQDILFISMIFIVLCLPVITIGIAASVCLVLAKLSIEGRKVEKMVFIKKYAKPILFKAFIMGIFDLLFIMITLLCLSMLLNQHTPYALKIMYVFFFGFDILFFLSSIYRYPILAYNDCLTLWEIFKKSLMLVCKNSLFCAVMLMVIITVLMLSVFTGIGVIFIFPGAALVLISCIYKQMIIKLRRETEKIEYENQ